jgi:hypothetical protein
MTIDKTKKTLPVRRAAEIARVDVSTVYRWSQQHDISTPYGPNGGWRRIDAEKFMRLLREIKPGVATDDAQSKDDEQLELFRAS